MTTSKHNLKMREVMKRNYYENGGRERKQIKYYKTKYNLGDAFFAYCKDHSSKLKKVVRLVQSTQALGSRESRLRSLPVGLEKYRTT